MPTPAKKPLSNFPTVYYHNSGRHQIVKSPDQIPPGDEWRDTPWPQKIPAGSDVDVNGLHPDQAITHLKDQLAEAQDTIRGLKSEIEWNKRKFDQNYGDKCDELSRALARIAELEADASPKKSKSKAE